jgi:hypothetical protein
MNPPLYFGLTSALEGHREGGGELSPEESASLSKYFARAILITSQFREGNAKLWQEFIESNPGDAAAKFMKAQMALAASRDSV